MKGRKDIYKDNNNGFQKNPENINRTGANRRPISAILKEMLDEKIVSFELILINEKGEEKVKKGTLKSKSSFNEVIAVSLLQKAISGDLKAMEIVLDRTEGKAQQQLDVTSGGEKIQGQKTTIVVKSKEDAEEVNDFISNL